MHVLCELYTYRNLVTSHHEILRKSIIKKSINNGDFPSGNFSCIYFTVHMRRDRSYYLIQVYLPSALIVILSWIGFWINYDAVPARLSLSVITVLTISTQTGDVRTQLPPVSYIKALDVWMSMCLIMVFASLIQFAIVNVTYRQTVKLKHRQVGRL